MMYCVVGVRGKSKVTCLKKHTVIHLEQAISCDDEGSDLADPGGRFVFEFALIRAGQDAARHQVAR